MNKMIGMRPFDLVLSRTPSLLSIQQTPLLDPSTSRAQFKIGYIAWLRGLMSTARGNLLAGQERYKRDNQTRYPTPGYQVGDQVLVNREAVLWSEEKTAKDQVNKKLAPRTEGPFPAVQVDDQTVTIIRGTGLNDRLSHDRVIKSPPLCRNVEDLPPRPAASNGDDGNLPGAAPSEGTLSILAPATSRTPGLMDAVSGGKSRISSGDSLDSALRLEKDAPCPWTSWCPTHAR